MTRRVRGLIALTVVVALILVGRLAWVQVVWGPDLAAQAQEQRARVYTEPARRGTVVDREGKELAYTMYARSLTVFPNVLRSELRQQQDLAMQVAGDFAHSTPEQYEAELDSRVAGVLEEMSEKIPRMISRTEASSHEVEEDRKSVV